MGCSGRHAGSRSGLGLRALVVPGEQSTETRRHVGSFRRWYLYYGANATENITLLRTLAGPGGTGVDGRLRPIRREQKPHVHVMCTELCTALHVKHIDFEGAIIPGSEIVSEMIWIV